MKVEKELARGRQSEGTPDRRNSMDKGSETRGLLLGTERLATVQSCWRLTCQVGRSVEAVRRGPVTKGFGLRCLYFVLGVEGWETWRGLE